MIEKLAEIYPQLYLDPDKEDISLYRDVVLKGKVPETKCLSHFIQGAGDEMDLVDTPAGKVYVVTLDERPDFERFFRCMMAAKDGPDARVPATTGAVTITAFNWSKIREHQKQFMEEQRRAGIADPDWSSEFKRFISVKKNYQDLLVVLSRGPYSGISAARAGQPEETWLETSHVIRKYHELTHVICRRLYPDDIKAVRDELAADTVGIFAAFGRFDIELEKKFLGITGERYTGGRLENYTEDAEGVTESVCRKLEQYAELTEAYTGTDPFGLIPGLMEKR